MNLHVILEDNVCGYIVLKLVFGPLQCSGLLTQLVFLAFHFVRLLRDENEAVNIQKRVEQLPAPLIPPCLIQLIHEIFDSSAHHCKPFTN